MNNLAHDILQHLPYRSAFRFVDHISLLTEEKVQGEYTLTGEEFFFSDHFPGNPITPGVILTEIMAQIGVVTMGIYLNLLQSPTGIPGRESFPLLSSSEVSFYKMVLPPQKVFVTSKKIYFRLGKLKCEVMMHDEKNELVAHGNFSGIVRHMKQGV